MNCKHVLSICAVALISGCETLPFQEKSEPPVTLLSDSERSNYTPPSASEVGLIPSAQKRFNEIPLPEGLREDTQRSFVYDSRSIKIGKMVYYAKHSVNGMAQFYITHAPKDGWSLISTTQADDSVLLFFEKPGKRLNVESRRVGVGRSNELILNYLPAAESAP